MYQLDLEFFPATGSNSIDLHQYRWIVLNTSGGKDSQTMIRRVMNLCERQGVNKSRIVLSHQCLGDMEWKGTLDLVKRHAEMYGLRLIVARYRNKDHQTPDLLEYVEKRGKWPSNKARFCTSEFKRSPGGRVITQLYREAKGDILNVFGFRADESPARAKRSVFSINARMSTKNRAVHDWLPIHDMSDAEVWQDIKESGIPYHMAYGLGMPRLSCVFCIFAPKAALQIAGKHNPDLLERYVQVEKRIGHSFREKLSLAEVQESINQGETIKAEELKNAWDM